MNSQDDSLMEVTSNESKDAFEEHEARKKRTEAYLKNIDEDRMDQRNRLYRLETDIKAVLGALGNDGERHLTSAHNSSTGERNVAFESRAHDTKANFLSRNVSRGEHVHVTNETAGSRQRAEASEQIDVHGNSLTGRCDGSRQNSYARENDQSKDSEMLLAMLNAV